MFSIGEHIIHPGQGVCTVTCSRTPRPHDRPRGEKRPCADHAQISRRAGRPPASLHRPRGRRASHLHIRRTRMRPHTERNSSLEESYFKRQLKCGAPETLRVAKTMRRRIHDAEARAKKPSSYYARVLKGRRGAGPSRSLPSHSMSPRRRPRRASAPPPAQPVSCRRSTSARPDRRNPPPQKGDRHQIERRRRGGARAIVRCSKPPPSPDGGQGVRPPTVGTALAQRYKAGVPGTFSISVPIPRRNHGTARRRPDPRGRIQPALGAQPRPLPHRARRDRRADHAGYFAREYDPENEEFLGHPWDAPPRSRLGGA